MTLNIMLKIWTLCHNWGPSKTCDVRFTLSKSFICGSDLGLMVQHSIAITARLIRNKVNVSSYLLLKDLLRIS